VRSAGRDDRVPTTWPTLGETSGTHHGPALTEI